MKNIMPEVAALLGVEIGEEFNVEGGGDFSYKITERGLIDQREYDWTTSLYRLLTGEWTIIKKPWKPNDGDKYHYIESDGNINWERFDSVNACDCALLHAGNFFRTEQEAEANRETIMEKFGWK
ncbi:MAG: hypothetical protein ACRC3H_13095 [Lachnospiraceae bacterium]